LQYFATPSAPLCKSAVVWLVRATYTFALLSHSLYSSMRCCGGSESIPDSITLLSHFLCSSVQLLWYGWSERLTHLHYFPTPSAPLCRSAVVWLVRVTYTFAILSHSLCSSVLKCCGMVGQSDLHICITFPLPLLLCAKVLWYGCSD